MIDGPEEFIHTRYIVFVYLFIQQVDYCEPQFLSNRINLSRTPAEEVRQQVLSPMIPGRPPADTAPFIRGEQECRV